MTFFDRLKNEAKLKDVKLETLCEIGKLDYESYKTLRRRGQFPRIDQVARMAKHLGVSMEYLLDGKDADFSFQDRALLDRARKYSSVLEDLESIDDASFKTFATSIHAVAEESRARKKTIGG